MRPVVLGQSISKADFDRWVEEALREIERASYEDIAEVADGFSITGSFTETRILDVSSPSTANIAAFLATFITDLKKRGIHKTE